MRIKHKRQPRSAVYGNAGNHVNELKNTPMNTRHRASFSAALIAFALSTLCHSQESGHDGKIALQDIALRDSVHAPVTLAELVIQIHNHTDILVRVDPGVYTASFHVNTEVYVKDGRSIGSMIEEFTQATGLHWRMHERTVEIYRVDPIEPAVKARQ